MRPFSSPATTSRIALWGLTILAGLVASASARADGPRPDPGYRTIGPPIAGTSLLDRPGDLADQLVAGADRFLLRMIDESKAGRASHWKRDVSSADAYAKSIEPNRRRLAHILGVRDPRVPFDFPDRVQGEGHASFKGDGLEIHSVRWPVIGDVTGEGLLIIPRPEGRSRSVVVVLPDADQTPEQLAGLAPGLPPERQVARRLAESGATVFSPVLIDRAVAPRMGGVKLTSREFLHRPAFVMGRTLIGYEVQKVLALVDHLAAEDAKNPDSKRRIGVFGYGEGGGVALAAAALDPRIDAACVSGYFDDRDDVWRQPLDRNVFGLLDQFGDAELASMVAPRPLVVEASAAPAFVYEPGQGGAPGRIASPKLETVRAEAERARKLVEGLAPSSALSVVVSGDDGQGPFGGEPALAALLAALEPGRTLAPVGPPLQVPAGSAGDPAARQARQLHEIDRHTQQLLVDGADVRREFMKDLDTRSIEAYAKSVEPYRERFATETIGRFDVEPLPPNVQSRQIFDEPTFTGYEVVMDVFPDLFASGILLVPKGIKEGERRPVVVCQHGLEGRPTDLADPNVENPAYHKFAVRLTERGFITFSPQNLYLFEDRFRTLQRKANPLGKTLFSMIVPQHRQITEWLKTLPQADPARIGFYGLSYGGKSAMRIPPLVENYRLSICSADFNEWVWKNASTRSPYSYVRTMEYEIFEFDLGSTFNYAEMAALIAPRPFMVERGHYDGVSSDEAVAYEFAKVFNLYDARLKIGDRCEIEVFDGPHTINGRGTFRFLHRHLNHPEPE
ncbi:alpha/beta hydrolase family protein [Planctomyces sp. SH-PL62]|uniref:alpha/beta hydrolase family protein n=1 Tax=Planctomyces sp. SH-PL62 TaxID=1636152 RepID=UPI00078EC611|nr:dienelactone hydrolase family protein [Planctomyces sp. SH-PL62]AMV37530.1 Alpha/beta hydrolase family protein [Planctomyces sp. SH-PL62]